MATAVVVQRVGPLDLVVSTVAVIFESPLQPPASISSQDVGEFLRLPSLGYSPDGSLAINSHRDQIEVLLSANKLDVRNVSGEHDKGVERVPAAVHGMCELFSTSAPKSFGVNFIVSVEQSEPRSWMAETFLRGDLASVLEDSPGSDMLSFVYVRGVKTITVRFDVRPGFGINVNYNASEEISALPGREELGSDLDAQKANLDDLLRALGLLVS